MSINKKLFTKDEVVKAVELAERQLSRPKPREGDLQHPKAQGLYKLLRSAMPNGKFRVGVTPDGVLFVAGQTYNLQGWLRQAGFRFNPEGKSWEMQIK